MADLSGPRVLVVDDEAQIGELISDSLQEAGFLVDRAIEGPLALSLLAEADDFKALITDIELCGPIRGWDLARQARERHADIAVVYITGTEAGDWTAQGVPGSIVIQKPFALAQIVAAVATLLNGSPPAPGNG